MTSETVTELIRDFVEMPKPSTRSESSESSECAVGVLSYRAVGVDSTGIDSMVNAACQKAIDILKSELMKMFSDITSRLVTVEQRLTTLERKATDYDTALNDLSTRVMGMQSTFI